MYTRISKDKKIFLHLPHAPNQNDNPTLLLGGSNSSGVGRRTYWNYFFSNNFIQYIRSKHEPYNCWLVYALTWLGDGLVSGFNSLLRWTGFVWGTNSSSSPSVKSLRSTGLVSGTKSSSASCSLRICWAGFVSGFKSSSTANSGLRSAVLEDGLVSGFSSPSFKEDCSVCCLDSPLQLIKEIFFHKNI